MMINFCMHCFLLRYQEIARPAADVQSGVPLAQATCALSNPEVGPVRIGAGTGTITAVNAEKLDVDASMGLFSVFPIASH